MSLTNLPGVGLPGRHCLTLAERIVFGLYAVTFCLWVFDINAADTALVTPINRRFLGGVTWLGAFLGVMLGWFVVRYSTRMRAETSFRRKVIMATLVLGTCGTFYAAIFYHAAWRAANIRAFAQSGSPITWAHFPIVSYRMRKSQPVVLIDRQGERRPIPISLADYQLLEGTAYSSRYCLKIQRQQVRSAVRVFLPSGAAPNVVPVEACVPS
jgi:hypothetical protein